MKSIALVFIALMMVGLVTAFVPIELEVIDTTVDTIDAQVRPPRPEPTPVGSYKVGGGGSDHSKTSYQYYDGACMMNLWDKVKPQMEIDYEEKNYLTWSVYLYNIVDDEFVQMMTSEEHSQCSADLWLLIKEMFI